MADDEGDEISMASLARRYWDEQFSEGLSADGVPPREIRRMRKNYVQSVLGNPEAMRLLRDMYLIVDAPERNEVDEPEQTIPGEQLGGPPGSTSVYRTKTGKVLTDQDIEQLAVEAEQGHEATTMRWDTSQKFVLSSGEMTLEAETALYKLGVRREMHTGSYRFWASVEAATALGAHADARMQLILLLSAFGLESTVGDVRLVCLGVPK